MKKIKEIKYAKEVPQSIVDLMGNIPYKYIEYYNTMHWASSLLGEPDILCPTVDERISVSGLGESGTLEDFIASLESYRDQPDYISGRMDFEYDYDYTEHYIIITKTRRFSEKEQAQHDEAKIEFEREREIFDRLQEIIKKEVKIKKQQKMADDKLALQKKIEKLENEAKRLKLKL